MCECTHKVVHSFYIFNGKRMNHQWQFNNKTTTTEAHASVEPNGHAKERLLRLHLNPGNLRRLCQATNQRHPGLPDGQERSEATLPRESTNSPTAWGRGLAERLQEEMGRHDVHSGWGSRRPRSRTSCTGRDRVQQTAEDVA